MEDTRGLVHRSLITCNVVKFVVVYCQYLIMFFLTYLANGTYLFWFALEVNLAKEKVLKEQV